MYRLSTRKSMIIILICFIICFILVSCSINTYKTNSNEDNNTGQPYKTVASPIIATNTQLVLSDNEENEAMENTSLIKKQCINYHENSIETNNLPGEIVFFDKENRLNQYIVNWSNNETKVFTPQLIHPDNYRISPNGEWLAYYSDEYLLVVESLITEELFTYSMKSVSSEFNYLVGWINNDTLIVLFYDQDSTKLDYLVSVNPFEGKIEKLPNEYPNIIQQGKIWRDAFWKSVTIYDPTMRYVVYLAYNETSKTNELVLWDRQEWNEIKSIENFDITTIMPKWLSDSSGFIFVKVQNAFENIVISDWFFMDINGEVKKLTNFSEEFDSSEFTFANLSNDESVVAFNNYQTDAQTGIYGSQLLFLNLETLDIYDPCLFVTPYTDSEWSPDSQYFIFLGVNEESEEITSRIIDIHENKIYTYKDNSIPLIWLN